MPLGPSSEDPDGQLELETMEGAPRPKIGASDTTPAQGSIQDALLAEGLLAVKLSIGCQSMHGLAQLLMENLGQNSLKTRSRYVQSITRWFFPDGIDGLLPRVWRAYADEAIIRDLLRWSYLAQEAVMGACVAKALFPLEPGISIPPTYFDKFLIDYLGKAPPEKTRQRIKLNLKKLGFLEGPRGKPDRLAPVVPQNTSFLVLLHHLFASRSARTVELQTLFVNPFWKYLGYKSEDALILRGRA